jgi:hypothetical protein
MASDGKCGFILFAGPETLHTGPGKGDTIITIRGDYEVLAADVSRYTMTAFIVPRDFYDTVEEHTPDWSDQP